MGAFDTYDKADLDTKFSAISTGAPTVHSFAPGAPSSTVSTSAVMMGLGGTCTFTPAASKVTIRIVGMIGVATTLVNATVCGVIGTGTAPSNGVSATGTNFRQSGLAIRPAVASATPNTPFTVADEQSVTPGTAYWVDLNLKTANASDAAAIAGLYVEIMECQ